LDINEVVFIGDMDLRTGKVDCLFAIIILGIGDLDLLFGLLDLDLLFGLRRDLDLLFGLCDLDFLFGLTD
jgi:hypothetical protein